MCLSGSRYLLTGLQPFAFTKRKHNYFAHTHTSFAQNCYDLWHFRLPFARTPLGFVVAILLDLWFTLTFQIITLAFAAIYISVYSNISSSVDDCWQIIVRSNARINVAQSIKGELSQFIQLHLHCFRCPRSSQFISVLLLPKFHRFTLCRGTDTFCTFSPRIG